MGVVYYYLYETGSDVLLHLITFQVCRVGYTCMVLYVDGVVHDSKEILHLDFIRIRYLVSTLSILISDEKMMLRSVIRFNQNISVGIQLSTKIEWLIHTTNIQRQPWPPVRSQRSQTYVQFRIAFRGFHFR